VLTEALGDALADALGLGEADSPPVRLGEGLGEGDSSTVGLGEGLAVWLSSVVGEGSATGVSLALSADDSDDDASEEGDSTEGDASVSSPRDPVRASSVSSDEGVVVGSSGVSGSPDSLTSGEADASCDSSDVGDGETEVVVEIDALGDGDDVVASLGMHRAGISEGMFHSDASDSSTLRLSSDCVGVISSDGFSSSAHALGTPVSRSAKAAKAVTMIRARERARAESKDGSAVITEVTPPLDQASPAARSTWSPGGSSP